MPKERRKEGHSPASERRGRWCVHGAVYPRCRYLQMRPRRGRTGAADAAELRARDLPAGVAVAGVARAQGLRRALVVLQVLAGRARPTLHPAGEAAAVPRGAHTRELAVEAEADLRAKGKVPAEIYHGQAVAIISSRSRVGVECAQACPPGWASSVRAGPRQTGGAHSRSEAQVSEQSKQPVTGLHVAQVFSHMLQQGMLITTCGAPRKCDGQTTSTGYTRHKNTHRY